MFPSITMQLDTMRKPQRFSLMNMSDGRIYAQSDKRLLIFSPETGEGMLSTKGNSQIDLMPIRGGKKITLSRREIGLIQDELAPVDPNGRTSLGGGVVQVANTMQVIG